VENGTKRHTGMVHFAKNEIDCWIKFDDVERLKVYNVLKGFCVIKLSLTKMRSSLQVKSVVVY